MRSPLPRPSARCGIGTRAAACALLACSGMVDAAVPSTFGTVIGNAILCLDHLDNQYFYSYLSNSFGAAYKREGGAYWFKTEDATLWGAPLTDVIVSDDSSRLVFVGAVLDMTPEKLEQSIIAASGLHYAKTDNSEFPVRESKPGSRIVYYSSQAKVFCVKHKQLPPGAG
jgi:hypothetical protein